LTGVLVEPGYHVLRGAGILDPTTSAIVEGDCLVLMEEERNEIPVADHVGDPVDSGAKELSCAAFKVDMLGSIRRRSGRRIAE